MPNAKARACLASNRARVSRTESVLGGGALMDFAAEEEDSADL